MSLFLIFLSFSQNIDKYSIKFDNIIALMVCLGFEPGTRRMVGADESTELWRPPETYFTTLEINVKNVLQYWSHPALFSLLKLL